jgi:hypothetical protein
VKKAMKAKKKGTQKVEKMRRSSIVLIAAGLVLVVAALVLVQKTIFL